MGAPAVNLPANRARKPHAAHDPKGFLVQVWDALNVVAIIKAKPGKGPELEALLQEALPGPALLTRRGS